MKSLKDIADRSYLTLEDLVTLYEYILETGYMTREKAVQEIERFVIDLNIDEYYFKTTPIDDMAGHLIATSASRLVAKFGGEDVGIELISEREDRAIYIVEKSKILEIEERIEKKYSAYRLESYRTREDSGLRLYILTKPVFENAEKTDTPEEFIDFAPKSFLETSVPETIQRYREAWEWMRHRVAPYISVSEKEQSGETRIMIGIQGLTATPFLSGFTRLIRKYGIHSNRKYMEPFLNEKRVFSFYFNQLKDEIIEELAREINTMAMLPKNPIDRLFYDGILSSQPTMYAISAAMFTNQFLNVLMREYQTLSTALKDQPEAKGILDKMKLRMVKDTFSETKIAETVIKHHEIVSLLYKHFANKFHPLKRNPDAQKEIEELISSRIETDVPGPLDKTILEYFLVFNSMILRTNFYKKYKICAGFRLSASFLDISDFPELPHGVFFIAGRHFLGFHVRFRDIARGGIRIVRSRNLAEYWKNRDLIFMENYNLASTQQKKNKDIAEGGSKGIILLDFDHQEEGPRAFKDYVDGLLDIIVAHEEVLNPEDEKEILFLGPDERTADLMDWASAYANKRGYPFWKAFTTGKAPENGGIPHDTYGMTTASTHAYVLAVLEKLGLKEESVSKFQTGGPDGDLGSNEIKVSRDKTVGIIDGSGVLYDPAGIDRDELLRLAQKRIMAENFDTSLLSPEGFFVSVEDKKITLPDGTLVPNGEEFRNTFHLHPLAAADLFVPCGGRPAAVNINNWKNLLDEKGTPKFKIIVEGANLFITEQARLRLEENGVILIKDAAANKGGVTSSSLEVLASLALSDEQFEEHMRVKDEKTPEFLKDYIDAVLEIIKNNARSEFNLLWSEHERTKTPFTILTNQISQKINDMTDAVFKSDLPAQPRLREEIITEYIPKPLLNLVGAETILKRVPEAYLDAIVASKIATNFVYRYGMDSNEVDFYHFLNNYLP